MVGLASFQSRAEAQAGEPSRRGDRSCWQASTVVHPPTHPPAREDDACQEFVQGARLAEGPSARRGLVVGGGAWRIWDGGGAATLELGLGSTPKRWVGLRVLVSSAERDDPSAAGLLAAVPLPLISSVEAMVDAGVYASRRRDGAGTTVRPAFAMGVGVPLVSTPRILVLATQVGLIDDQGGALLLGIQGRVAVARGRSP